MENAPAKQKNKHMKKQNKTKLLKSTSEECWHGGEEKAKQSEQLVMLTQSN